MSRCNWCHQPLDPRDREVRAWGNFYYCDQTCLDQERALFDSNRGGAKPPHTPADSGPKGGGS